MDTRVLDRLRELRARVLARIRDVNNTTEEGVLGAGRHIQRAVTTAHGHIARLREVLSGPVGNEDSDLAQAIRSQADHTRQHAKQVAAAVAAQARQVGVVSGQVRSITKAAREIERLNAAARVLSINARIEASRSAGSAVFSAIATEMQQLSRAIASANKTVFDLASAMEQTVPELVRDNQTLGRVIEGFEVESRERIAEVEQRAGELRATVGGALAESDTALAEVVSESHAALSKLQFQDVCAQGLLQLDTWAAETSEALARELDLEGDVPPSAHTSVTSDDVNVAHAVAGEVMMF